MSSAGELSRTLQEVQTTFQGGNPAGAMALSEKACAAGLEHPILLTLAAHHNLQAGDAALAHSRASRAGEMAPHSPDVMNALGLSLLRLGRGRDALAAFEAGLRASSGLAALHYGKAQAHELLHELDQVSTALHALLALEPGNVEALAWLGDLATHRDDVAAARDYAGRALALQPNHHGARITLAVADIAERKYDEAERRLTPLLADASLTPINRSFVHSLIGDALDGLDRPAEAFAQYAQAKQVMRRYYAPAAADGTSADRVARLTGYFRESDAAPWAAKKGGIKERPETRAERGPSSATNKDSRTHVFLVGFPRSGTTLLEQVLASHPEVETMEERDAFEPVIRDFMNGLEGLDRLAKLPDAGLEPYRDAYWAHAAKFGHKADKPVFVDKMPLNTILMPVIARLFPDAKILFALRDPRDVVLSCFRRRFSMTAQMYELTTLESAAAYYDAVMGLSEIYRAKLGLDLIETRHENLLADFEGETRRICHFLGLEWREEMKNFARRAQESAIATPSGAQIARGLNTSGMDQWRRYETQMAPVLPRLQPWVARFGYEGGA